MAGTGCRRPGRRRLDPIPPGAGAILVPSMSGPDSEPQALVFRGEEQVASGPNGARIVVEAGAYLVRVGSGPVSQMVSVPVDVQAGATTVVPVRWGGLRIEVVDESNLPHRGVYELIRVADRQPYTVGFGADTLQGERLLALLMAPGLYRIVQSGSTYRARTDFATVLVPEGGLVHYRLVINPTSGQFRGAGVVTPDELGAVPDISSWEAPEVSPWNRRYAIGLSAPFASTRNVIGASNETTFGTDLFFDNYVTYQRDRDLFSSVLELESGFVKVRPEASAARPWQKTHDRLRSDVLYSRFLNARVGPYARFGLRTTLFESNTLVTEDTLISRQFVDGRRELAVVPANSTFPTSDAFRPARVSRGGRPEHPPAAGAGDTSRLAGRGRLSAEPVRGRLLPRRRRNDPRAGVRGGHQLPRDRAGDDGGRDRPLSILLYNTNLDVFSDFGAPRADDRLAQYAELAADARVVAGLQGRPPSAAAGERQEPGGPAVAVSLLDRLVTPATPDRGWEAVGRRSLLRSCRRRRAAMSPRSGSWWNSSASRAMQSGRSSTDKGRSRPMPVLVKRRPGG